MGEDVIELRLQRRQLRRIATLHGTLVRRLIEINGRFFELIKHEDDRTEQQNEKLHWHFHSGIEKQPETTLFERASREISLHLRLIRPEIGKREKKTANQARPECVALVGINRKIDRLKFAHFARNRERASKREIGR